MTAKAPEFTNNKNAKIPKKSKLPPPPPFPPKKK